MPNYQTYIANVALTTNLSFNIASSSEDEATAEILESLDLKENQTATIDLILQPSVKRINSYVSIAELYQSSSTNSIASEGELNSDYVPWLRT